MKEDTTIPTWFSEASPVRTRPNAHVTFMRSGRG
jgi:hypothetical protein